MNLNLDRLLNGLENLMGNAALRHDTYDVGYIGAMIAHVKELAPPAGLVLVPLLETEPMQDAARGILQAVRNIRGCTEQQVYTHCKMRGDSVEGLHHNYTGYVTEARAAAMIYRAMVRASQTKEVG